MSTTTVTVIAALILVVGAVALSAVALTRTRRGVPPGENDRLGTNIPVGMALGAGFGVALGAAFGNVALGIPISVVFGLALGTRYRT